jgi:digeranylgeranylglycerophospholipid reductase
LFDTVIIGGGPAGSRTAYLLAEKGYRVAVLEKHSEIGHKPCCTGIVSRECAQYYDIPTSVIFRSPNRAKIFSPSGAFVEVSRPEPQASILNRPEFDRFLAAKSRVKGAEYYLNCRVEDVFITADCVKIDALEKGRARRFEAKSVILSVGFGSALAKKMGFNPGHCVGAAQAEVDTNGLEEVEVYFDQDLAPGFFAWLVPTLPGKGLAGLLTRKSPSGHLRAWLGRLEKRGKLVPGRTPILHHGGIPIRPISRTYRDRLLVVGDAAGQVKPTTGGGIYFGMLCADAAARTLDEALTVGDFSARKLSLYERGWRTQIGHELNIEYFARRIYERLNNTQLDGLIARLNSSGTAGSLIESGDFSFDWHGKLMIKALKQVAISRATRFFKK